MIVRGIFVLVVAAAALPAFAAPDITLTMTVGDASHFADPQSLPTATTYAAEYGETISIGYEIENSGTVALTTHDLVDSELGAILTNFSFTLNPAAKVFLIQQAVVTEAVNFQGTWTAYNAGMTDVAVDNDIVQVTLKQGMLSLEVTVGDITHYDDQTLPPSDFYLAAQDEPISVGYEVTNTGSTILRFHDLGDSEIGVILAGFPFMLGPGEAVYIVQQSVATANTTFRATWSGREAADAPPTVAMGAARVFINDPIHSADTDASSSLSLSEMLRAVQLYNSDGFGCMVDEEDGYLPNGSDQTCRPHNCDISPRDWKLSLGELLRLVQLFNSNAYHFCPMSLTEDGFCPGLP